MTKNRVPYAGRVRAVAYLTPEQWEALTKFALAEDRSVSAYLSAMIVKQLNRQGANVLETEGRGKRTDFKPAATLKAALIDNATRLEAEAARKRAKADKLRKADR
jgi:hypothetical protein